ncbi:hypothetical protein RUM44_013034 [Polyplax serrata]|uniref:Exostosin-2 n=1 Tax=Polyplax serrata TaxID=468196 RepID=A0ABR1BD07_POLSC
MATEIRHPKEGYCDARDHKIQIYVYPLRTYFDDQGNQITPQISLEYYKILKTIVNSKYYSPNPEEACILVPSIDTLNQNRLKQNEVSKALSTLPYWRNGENHLIWNFISGSPPDYSNVIELNIGNSLVAGAGFSSWTYRSGFDISLPLFSPYLKSLNKVNQSLERKWFVVNSQVNLHTDYERELSVLPNLVQLKLCPNKNPELRCYRGKQYDFPAVLQEATFCLIIRGARLAQQALLESLAAGCIPVIAADMMVMPFEDVIDWKRAAVVILESDLSVVIEKLTRISDLKKKELQQQGMWLYLKYFMSIEKITLTTLDIINQRVYPQNALHYEDWNMPHQFLGSRNPLKLQLTAPRSPGFTAVVLTYDRVDSLFLLIQQLARVPSLSKILVIWNNQNKDPPSTSAWPKLAVPMELIRTKENKLSNRFYPYDQIETEAVLSIDDDIVMLTPDELEFGFEVWREFPDRIVGFPSRTHVWDNTTNQWKYESEWTNRISMVLTGAAFHHKYWNYLYTTAMPGDIKQWVDSHMNCEDIAMNFLVANVTRKSPIKVTPRKKFKCPECVNTEMLSADLTHMVERSHCINKFTTIYGNMPLIDVEFRADPVLFKDNFPEKLKRYNDIGSL